MSDTITRTHTRSAVDCEQATQQDRIVSCARCLACEHEQDIVTTLHAVAWLMTNEGAAKADVRLRNRDHPIYVDACERIAYHARDTLEEFGVPNPDAYRGTTWFDQHCDQALGELYT